MFFIVQTSRLDYVFKRIDKIQERNLNAGGITIDRILDGSAFNRETAFAISKERYHSKNTWIIGYGWGIGNNNRDAFYVNPNNLRGSAHSQIFAVLFIFGWLGFIAYWGLVFRIIYKSYKTISYKKVDYFRRMMAYFFFIALSLFAFNEIKVDSISIPNYFSVTIIWLGLAYSTCNTFQNKKLINNISNPLKKK